MEIKKVKVHIYGQDGKEIKTRNFGKVFDVYEKGGKFGIDWNTERSPYTSRGDVFVPFEHFSHTVIFEDVESGKLYHYSNIHTSVIEVKEMQRT